MEKTLLVTIDLFSERKNNWSLEDLASELEELARSTGVEIADNLSCVIDKPTANFFIGKGKTEEISMICQMEEIDTVIFSHNLSGTQQRNLEEVIGKKTIDRTQLILDIFAQHARSPEGKLQVELAQLQYLFPRLVGKGIILSRLGGGIGTRGPGEQKLEVDRRRIRKRIEKLKEDLENVTLHRRTLRKKRKENAIPTVALVGYTNAGKSTLLNSLTLAGQTVRDSLFTTLDPLSKSLKLPGGEKVIISDTVGFLHDLPHNLIEAFKATLEEVVEADLLLHVLDISHPLAEKFNKSVLEVLKVIDAADKPMITVLNKIDLLEDKTWLGSLKNQFPGSVAVSALLKQNLEILLRRIEETFSGRMSYEELELSPSRMDLVDLFYREGKVKEVKYTQKAIKIKVNLPKSLLHKLLHSKEINIIS